MIGIILTGITKGLGKAFFDELIKKDLYLFCISRRFLSYQEELEKKKKLIKLILCDLSKPEDLTNTLEFFGSIPFNEIEELFFINNAGIILPIEKIGKMDNKLIYDSILVNLFAPILFTNKILQYKDLKITIINITSGAANNPYEGWAMYCSTKAAFKMFSEVLSAENKNNKKIVLHNVDPGVIDTEMQRQIRNSTPDKFPLHELFVKFKNDGKLAPAEKVAKKIIIEYINI